MIQGQFPDRRVLIKFVIKYRTVEFSEKFIHFSADMSPFLDNILQRSIRIKHVDPGGGPQGERIPHQELQSPGPEICENGF